MTFEDYLTNISAGPDISAGKFQWYHTRIPKGQKAAANGFPWGVLAPFGDDDISDSSSCNCKQWQRQYNLTLFQCPVRTAPAGRFWKPEPDVIAGFMNQLVLIGHPDLHKVDTTFPVIDEVFAVVTPHKFICFEYLYNPQALTYDEDISSWTSTMRFRVVWQTC